MPPREKKFEQNVGVDDGVNLADVIAEQEKREKMKQDEALKEPEKNFAQVQEEIRLKNEMNAAKEAIRSQAARLVFGNTLGHVVRNPPGSEFLYDQKFEFGSIGIRTMPQRPICEPYYTADIFLAAIRCYGTEDPGSPFKAAADEPYLIVSLMNPAAAACGDFANTGMVWSSPVFQDIRPHRVFGENLLIFKNVIVGKHGIALKLALMEQEYGSAESLRKEIQLQADRAANTFKDALQALSGIDIDNALKEQANEDNLLDTLGDVGLGFLTDLLKDDKIAEKQWIIDAGVIKDWVDNGTYAASEVKYPGVLPDSIHTNFPFEDVDGGDKLFSGGGGSYKVYLRVIPQKWVPV